LVHSHGGNSNGVTHLKVVLRADTLTIEPNLPAAQQLIDMALGHIFQPFDQKIVNTLTPAVLTYNFRDRSTEWNFFA
jgi:hypothetical protein